MDKDQYYSQLMDEIGSISASGGHEKNDVFTEVAAELLSDSGAVDVVSLVSFCNKSRGVRVDGFAFAEEQGLLTLYITDFYDDSSIIRLSRDALTNSFKRGVKFFINSFNDKYINSLGNELRAKHLAEVIFNKADLFDKVKFVILTNAELSSRVGELPGGTLHGYKTIFDIWHLERFFKLDQAGRQREEIVIDFSEFGDKISLPCLPVTTNSDAYSSYLLAVPGALLAQLYDQFGERLLEQNVRTFLQFRVKVNRGIRDTLKTEPEMFFAYNNGITATADEVVLKEQNGSVYISKVVNLQIVNGGQTTASLATALRKDKTDLAKVCIQVKLSVISCSKEDTLIPKISEYANTQNKINSADFLSNHPFHRRIEELSRQVLAPAMEGSPMETHWFYERARGQFATTQLPMTPADKNHFLKQNPQKQMFNKTDLAKFTQSWDLMPYLVSLGAQKNFAYFSKTVNRLWRENPDDFNQDYFQLIIAKAILFRSLDRLIMKQSWYGGYKANIVTYTISILSFFANKNNKLFDFNQVWKTQGLSTSLTKFLLDLAEKVNMKIQQTPDGVTNVTEWCKKEDCWIKVMGIAVENGDAIIPELQDV